MRATPVQLLRVWLGAAVLIIAAALLGTFRPVLRFHSQRPGRAGVHQAILPPEISDASVVDQRPSAGSGALANQYASAALLSLLLSIVAIVLNAPRTAFVSIAVHRLKLPRDAADSSPPP